MKKILFTLCAAMLVASASFSQGLHLGVKGGANLSKIDGMAFKDGYNLGYQLGAFMEVDFSKNVGIQPELLWSQTNTKYSQEFKDTYEDIPGALNPLGNDKVKLNYLSIPILLRLNAGKMLTFHAGPSFSVLTSTDQNLIEEGKSAFKNGDVGGVLGAQINLGTLRVYGRYTFGLSDISDFSNSNDWKNQQIQIGLGIKVL